MGELTEQLRLILEPTLASKLAGDYRTGKRINMKKVRAGVWCTSAPLNKQLDDLSPCSAELC